MSSFDQESQGSPTPLSGLAEEPRLLTRTTQEDGAFPGRRAAAMSNAGKATWKRILLRGGTGLLMLAIILLPVTALWLRHALRVSLPQLDGTIQTTGLNASVVINRDAHGVPSIQASSLDDLLFAQGYVTAQDRLWQMDALRRHAAGELAEILGSRLLAHDRTQRYLQLRASADRAVLVLPPAQLHQLGAYAQGVNAFLAANGDHLPIEFHLLHYKPAAWTPRDSLLVALAMAQDLSTEFPVKLARESLAQHLSPDLIADLYPVGSWRDHPPGQTSPDLTSPRPEVEQIPLDDSQTRMRLPSATPDDLLAVRNALLQQACDACRAGSNNWAVAGQRSASAKPLVSNDMHLALGIPGIWYEASLRVKDGSLDVTGFTLPGTPFVIVGRNAHVAWGFTNLGADTQDIYVEHLRGSGSGTEFKRLDGTWASVDHRPERIRVRGGSDVTLDVQATTHFIGATQISTPVITPLYPSEHRSLALVWTVYDPAAVTSPFFAIDTAKDGASLVTALASLGSPSLNAVYADDQNHIGYHALGRIPVRGPAVHHPIDPVPVEAPGTTRELPPDEDNSALFPLPQTGSQTNAEHAIFSSHMRLQRIAFRPQRRASRPKGKIRNLSKPQPKPEEANTHPAPLPLGFTVGSPIPPVPVDALDPAAVWSEYVPYSELPSVADPVSGVLATANARVTPDAYPYALALDWAAPYRVERITRLLTGRTLLTAADMLRIQMDVHSEFDLALAHRFAYALDQSALAHPGKDSSQSRHLRQAADILRNWNGDVDPNAAAPAIIAATRAELLPMLLVPQIAAHDRALVDAKSPKPETIARLYSWQAQSYALEQLVLHAPARWLPPEFSNWNELLAIAVSRGLSSAHAPADLATWAYGKQHPVEFTHPLLSTTPVIGWLLGIKTEFGPQFVGGDTSTVKATSHAFGPSERFTADLSSPDATTANITTGQSGNPKSPWYLDQLSSWLGGTTLPAPLHGNPAAHTLTLTP